MRRVLYRVAASVDGYIAGPHGEVDWIVHDPAVDLAKVYESVDTVLLGRRTYELTQQPGAPPWPQGWQIYVFSRTLTAAGAPRRHGRKQPTLARASLRSARPPAGRSGSLAVAACSGASWWPSRWTSWRSQSSRSCSGAVFRSWRPEHR